jgi:hypothetical protein
MEKVSKNELQKIEAIEELLYLISLFAKIVVLKSTSLQERTDKHD